MHLNNLNAPVLNVLKCTVKQLNYLTHHALSYLVVRGCWVSLLTAAWWLTLHCSMIAGLSKETFIISVFPSLSQQGADT